MRKRGLFTVCIVAAVLPLTAFGDAVENRAAPYLTHSPVYLTDIEYRDNSTLKRLSRLEKLSILTLADFGNTRLYLGVTRDGFVGLHFDLIPRHSRNRHLELARLPNLRRSPAIVIGEQTSGE